ncbi:MAG: hypothetical protein AABZ47_16120 [Planctomycetota bacterium]
MNQQNTQLVPVQHSGPSSQPPMPVRRRRWFFRWEFVCVPLGLLFAAWLIQNVPGPTFSWDHVMEGLGVSRRNEKAYTQLAVMGLVLIALVYVLKVFRSK